MGVKYLGPLMLQQKYFREETIKASRPLRFVVDGSALLYHFFNELVDWRQGACYALVAQELCRLFSAFAGAGANVVAIVFECPYSSRAKREERRRRAAAKRKCIEGFSKYIQKLEDANHHSSRSHDHEYKEDYSSATIKGNVSRHRIVLPTLATIVTIDALTALSGGPRVVQVVGEADSVVFDLARSMDAAVLSEDSDFLVMGDLPRGYVLLKTMKWDSPTTLRFLRCIPSEVAKHFSLDIRAMPLFGICAGNDFICREVLTGVLYNEDQDDRKSLQNDTDALDSEEKNDDVDYAKDSPKAFLPTGMLSGELFQFCAHTLRAFHLRAEYASRRGKDEKEAHAIYLTTLLRYFLAVQPEIAREVEKTQKDCVASREAMRKYTDVAFSVCGPKYIHNDSWYIRFLLGLKEYGIDVSVPKVSSQSKEAQNVVICVDGYFTDVDPYGYLMDPEHNFYMSLRNIVDDHKLHSVYHITAPLRSLAYEKNLSHKKPVYESFTVDIKPEVSGDDSATFSEKDGYRKTPSKGSKNEFLKHYLESNLNYIDDYSARGPLRLWVLTLRALAVSRGLQVTQAIATAISLFIPASWVPLDKSEKPQETYKFVRTISLKLPDFATKIEYFRFISLLDSALISSSMLWREKLNGSFYNGPVAILSCALLDNEKGSIKEAIIKTIHTLAKYLCPAPFAVGVDRSHREIDRELLPTLFQKVILFLQVVFPEGHIARYSIEDPLRWEIDW